MQAYPHDPLKPGAALVVGAPPQAAALAFAVRDVGGTALASVGWDRLAGELAQSGERVPIAADTAGTDPDVLAAALPALAAAVASDGVRAVVRMALDQLDQVGGALVDSGVLLLCDPSPRDEASALAALLSIGPDDRLHERGQDERQLRQLNEDVARIAETLARLSRSATKGEPDLAKDRPLRALSEPDAQPGPPVTARDVREAIRARRLRDHFLGAGLFEDPAWDMLLDLYAAELERGQVSVSSLCIAAHVAPTTALRWIGKMTDRGLLVRHPDPFDRRRAFMALSKEALGGMAAYAAALGQAGLRFA